LIWANHCLDTLEYILDSRVKELSCFTASLVQDYPAEDSALLSVKFANGALGVWMLSFLFRIIPPRIAWRFMAAGEAFLAEGRLVRCQPEKRPPI